MAFRAYLLRCADGSYYAGHTDALEHRIGQHRIGQHRIGQHQIGRGSDYTARRQPGSLAWCQDFPSRPEALEAERRFKGWSRAVKEMLIAGDWERVSQLAVAYGARPSAGLGRTGENGTSSAIASVRSELRKERAHQTTPPCP